MLPSIPILALLAVYLTSYIHAAPLPQGGMDLTTNAPAGPSMTSSSDLSNTLGDLVIPQEIKATNGTAPAVNKERSAPTNLDELVNEIGDFKVPTNTTAGSVAIAVKRAVPSLSDADSISIVQALHPAPS